MILETYSKQAYKTFKPSDKSATLSSQCFEFGGGGSEAIIVMRKEKYLIDSSLKGITPPLDSHYYLGQGSRGVRERVYSNRGKQ